MFTLLHGVKVSLMLPNPHYDSDCPAFTGFISLFQVKLNKFSKNKNTLE